MVFHVSLEKAEDGWMVAECPALPGCVSQGRDEKEVLETLKKPLSHGSGPKIRKPFPR